LDLLTDSGTVRVILVSFSIGTGTKTLSLMVCDTLYGMESFKKEKKIRNIKTFYLNFSPEITSSYRKKPL